MSALPRRKRRRRRRRNRWLTRFLMFVGLLVLAEAAVVLYVTLSPETPEPLEQARAAATRWWSGTKDTEGMATRLSQWAGDTADGWKDSVNDLVAGQDTTVEPDDTFSGCLKCHNDYAEKIRFVSTYMDHPLHAELGVACKTCHLDVEHPGPLPPPESVCAKCHDEVNDTDQCITCHAPGSVPHFYRLGYPRDQKPECDTCHPPGSFDTTARSLVNPPATDGSDRSYCTSCHQAETCEGCHGTAGAPGAGVKHPAGWVQQHGEIAVATSSCTTCHTTRWCADSCHSNTERMKSLRGEAAPSKRPRPEGRT